jgi:uncharacterized protein
VIGRLFGSVRVGRSQGGVQYGQAWSFLSCCSQIFDNLIVERVDDRENYGELRMIGLGRVEFDIYRVVYTWRNELVVRIISAQRANNNERKVYYRAAFS